VSGASRPQSKSSKARSGPVSHDGRDAALLGLTGTVLGLQTHPGVGSADYTPNDSEVIPDDNDSTPVDSDTLEESGISGAPDTGAGTGFRPVASAIDLFSSAKWLLSTA